MEEPYSNIRQLIGHMIGLTIIDITQHDADEFAEDGRSYVQILLSDGEYLKFYVGDDGFEHSEQESQAA